MKENSRCEAAHGCASGTSIPFRIDGDEAIEDLQALCGESPELAGVLGMQVGAPVEIDYGGYLPDAIYTPVTFEVQVTLVDDERRGAPRVFEPGTVVIFDDFGWIGTMTPEELSARSRPVSTVGA